MEPEEKPTPSSTGAEFGKQVAELAPGQKADGGRYTLIKFLGKGGMGIVWLARDEHLRDEVALKFLPVDIHHDVEALDDMRRETLKSRKLSHPNIIRIHDLHVVPGESPFISMEYIAGAPLNVLKAKQPQRFFAWEYLKPIIKQLCDALDYAHQQKVIHRDLKPANMMLTEDGDLKLADFGIAAVVSESMSRVSLKHSTSGTVVYMSPQQMNGQRPAPSDDIYALGATIYELLTSKPPFYTGDVIHQVQNIDPQPLAERLADLGLSNDIPPDVCAMVMACLSKDHTQRPQSAAAVAEWIGLPSATSASRLSAAQQESTPATEDLESAPTMVEGSEASEPAVAGQGKTGLWIGLGLAAVLVVAVGGWLMFGKSDGKKTANTAVAASPIPPPNTNASPSPAPSPSAFVAPEMPAADPDGWMSLVNGKDLYDWRTGNSGDAWEVVGTNLVGDFANEGKHRMLSTEGYYANFLLRFSVRFQPTGVSSEKARLSMVFRDNWQLPGGPNYGINILSDGRADFIKSNGNDVTDAFGSGIRLAIRDLQGKEVKKREKAFPSLIGKQVFKPDAWNAWLIQASNTTVTVFCNGQPVLQLQDEAKSAAKEGPISIYLHPDYYHKSARNPFRVEIKDMFIKPIDATPVAPPATAKPVAKSGNATRPQTETIDLGGGVKMEFVLIPAGSFMMGYDTGLPDDRPVHKVTLTKPFYLGKYEVTQEQWQAVMGINPSRFKGPKLPVEQVSWNDCQSFLAKVQKKAGRQFALPTEAQWEYAVRADTTTGNSFGDSEASLGDYAWFSGNADSTTHPVGEKKPNPWGLYDMQGNVWEWCADWFGPYSSVEATDPQGSSFSSKASRVFRGGAWDRGDPVNFLATRGFNVPVGRNDFTGLRCVLVSE